jgi:hypothetical protein
LGSIKIPLNLEDEAGDFYVQDGNQPLYFKSLLNKQIDESRFIESFTKSHGGVTFFWTSKDMTECCVVFISSEEKRRFEELHLK